MPLKIDVYSVMRNEIKILPYFLRHYEQFADRIFVWDDQSDDGTREMLARHPKVVLLGLTHHGANDMYYVQSLWPQYRLISRGYADWVMCVDADEFIYHPNLVQFLSECGEKGIQKIRCTGYTMHSTEFPHWKFKGQLYDLIKMGWADRWSTKTVVFDPAIQITFTPGRHQCLPSRNIITYKNIGLKMLHYRYLGPKYFKDRNIKNCKLMGIPFIKEKKHNLPDGTHDIPYEWYEDNKDKLINVVDL